MQIVTLAALHGRARPLLVFAPSAEDARLKEQLRQIESDQHAAAERQLLTITIALHGSPSAGARLSDADADAARHRFRIAPSAFQVILLGKDGGAKLRSSEPISLGKLIEIIDSMPMRHEEMRRDSSPP